MRAVWLFQAERTIRIGIATEFASLRRERNASAWSESAQEAHPGQLPRVVTGSGFLPRTSRDSLTGMTAQIGDGGLDLFGDPRPELLADVARARPEPGGEWADLGQLGFRSTQRLRLSDLGGDMTLVTWPAELQPQARYLYGDRLGSGGCCCRAWLGGRAAASPRVPHGAAGQAAVHASDGCAA